MMRELLGVLARDLPRYAAALARPGAGYLAVRNRAERLEPAPGGEGFRCAWRWASDLHAPRVLPILGRLLLRRALAAHPIVLRERPGTPAAAEPEVSFVIGHRGLERLPLLLAAVRSIAGQGQANVECLVVEQSQRQEIREALPAWVRYLHQPVEGPPPPFSRGRAFNAGARAARGRLLVFHDGDLLVPSGYAGELARLHGAGSRAIDLKRFVFYLSPAHTARALAAGGVGADEAPAAITQNLQGGSSGVDREGFGSIGGFDESFEGWGGEDNEFWERCGLLERWGYGSLPLVHLWHPPQPEKSLGAQGPGAALYAGLSRLAPEERVRRLLERRGRGTTCAGSAAGC